MKKIILTGGIATGKSEASKLFQALGVPVIDADKIAHDLLAYNTPDYLEVIKHFGTGILEDNKNINRAELGAVIFSDISEKTWLENLLHPKILTEIKAQITQLEQQRPAPLYCIIDIPIYAEIILSPAHSLKSNYKQLADKVLVIDLDELTQYNRLLERYRKQNIEPDFKKIKDILAAQASRTDRNKLADDIILNNQDLAHLKASILTLHQHYSKMA